MARARQSRLYRKGDRYVLETPPVDLGEDWGIAVQPGRTVLVAGGMIAWYADEAGVEYGGGRFLIPRRFWALFDGANIALRLEVAHRELVCTQVVVRRGERDSITATDLRRLPLARMIQAAGQRAAHVIDSDRDTQGIAEFRPAILWDDEGWASAYAAEAHTPRRGKRLADEHFQQVADIYRAARASGQSPVIAITQAMHTSRSNAGRWVMEARRRGFLGEAPARGQAGEKEDNDG